ncbi:MAG: hypothetical protein JKY42_02325 [Flavobacteriales bacterium]|nr:hypothetical protein [Flavobacteriales bacterium]
MKKLLLAIPLALLALVTQANNPKLDATTTNKVYTGLVDSLQQDAANRGGYVYNYQLVEPEGKTYHTFSGWQCYMAVRSFSMMRRGN